MMGLAVLILGSSGIIGRELTLRLLQLGAEVHGMSRSGHEIPREVLEVVPGLFTDARGDSRDPKSVRGLVEGKQFDVVVDLVSFDARHLVQLLPLLERTTGQYVFISSATVYQSAPAHQSLCEESPLATSHWGYPHSKQFAEEFLRSHSARIASMTTIVRPYITYSDSRAPLGVWEGQHLFPRILRDLPVVLGDEVAKARTSLTHARDVARALTLLMGDDRAKGRVFNIASDTHLTWTDVYTVASEAIGRDIEVAPIPLAELVAVFPELRGRAEDRARDRTFCANAIREFDPLFQFENSTRASIASAMAASASSTMPGLGAHGQGRMDRLLRHSSKYPKYRPSLARHRRLVREDGPAAFGKYLAGYMPILDRLTTPIMLARERATPSDYYVGRR